MKVDEMFCDMRAAISSQRSSTLVLVWSGHESWENARHANSRFSTLMQLLFSFDLGMRVEKTPMQTLAYQLSSSFERTLPLYHKSADWEVFNYKRRPTSRWRAFARNVDVLIAYFKLFNLSQCAAFWCQKTDLEKTTRQTRRRGLNFSSRLRAKP
jgi:hypothetical protein